MNSSNSKKKSIERNDIFLVYLSRAYAIFILCLFPFLLDKTQYGAMTIFKFRAFRTTALVYFALCVILIGVVISTYRKFPRIKISISQILVLAYVAWSAISALKSPYGKETWIGQGRFEGMLSILLYSGSFLFLSFWGEDSIWIKRLFCVSAVIEAFFCIDQFMGANAMYHGGTFWSSSFVGTIGNIDCVGGYLSVAIPVIFCCYVFAKDKKWMWGYLATLFFLTIVFVQIDVDSQKIGLLGAAAVFLPFMLCEKETAIKALRALGIFCVSAGMTKILHRTADGFKPIMSKMGLLMLFAGIVLVALSFVLALRKTEFKALEKKLLVIVWIGAIFAVLLFIFFYNGDINLLKEASQLMHGHLSDKMGSSRGYIWKSSIKLANEMPVFGSGPGTFQSRYVPYEIFKTRTDYAHNDFLNIAVCTGYVGMLLYIAFIGSLLLRAFIACFKKHETVIYAAGVLGFMIHTVFAFSIAIVSPLYWICAGLLDNLLKADNH